MNDEDRVLLEALKLEDQGMKVGPNMASGYVAIATKMSCAAAARRG
jgi:hypothetical protein